MEGGRRKSGKEEGSKGKEGEGKRRGERKMGVGGGGVKRGKEEGGEGWRKQKGQRKTEVGLISEKILTDR